MMVVKVILIMNIIFEVIIKVVNIKEDRLIADIFYLLVDHVMVRVLSTRVVREEKISIRNQKKLSLDFQVILFFLV